MYIQDKASHLSQLYQQVIDSKWMDLDIAQQASQLAQISEELTDIIQSDILLGTCYVLRRDIEKAEEHLCRAQKYINQENSPVIDLPFLFTLNNASGTLFSHLGNFQRALFHYKLAASHADKMGDTTRYQIGLINLGYVYSEFGDWDQAIEYLERAIRYPALDKSAIRSAYHYLADIFEFQQLWEQALVLRLKAMEVAGRKDQIAIIWATNYCRLAHTHMHLQKFDKAWHFIAQARTFIAEASGVGATLARIEKISGYIHLAQGDYSSAEICYHKAIALLSKKKYPQQDVISTKILMARILFWRGHYHQCLVLTNQLDRPDLRIQAKKHIYTLKKNIYIKLEEWEQVYKISEALQKVSAVRQASLYSFYRLKEKSSDNEIILENNHILAQKNAELEALHHEKDELFSIVVHDLRNPISALGVTLGNLQKFRDKFSKAELTTRLATCVKTTNRMGDIVSQLTLANKLDRDPVKFELISDYLAPHIKQLVTQHVELANQKNQKITVVQIDPVPKALFDSYILGQVMSNLLSNAIKYSPHNTLIQILIRSNESNHVCVEVHDQGLGLSDLDQQSLFKKYMKLSARPTAGESSTGLGLYITKRLVETIGGTISAESIGKNLGSIFTITFPVAG